MIQNAPTTVVAVDKYSVDPTFTQIVLIVSGNHSATSGHLIRVNLFEEFVFILLERPNIALRMLANCKLAISLKLRYFARDLIGWTVSYCFKVPVRSPS